MRGSLGPSNWLRQSSPFLATKAAIRFVKYMYDRSNASTVSGPEPATEVSVCPHLLVGSRLPSVVCARRHVSLLGGKLCWQSSPEYSRKRLPCILSCRGCNLRGDAC